MNCRENHDSQEEADQRDKKLVKLTLEGRDSAFQDLVACYSGPLLSLAYRMCGDYEEAEEAVQDIFTKVYSSLPKYDPRYRFFSWIYTISINYIRSIKRSKSFFQRKQTLCLDDVTNNNPIAGNSAGPDQITIRNEAERAVEKALMKLKRKHREVFVMRHIQELSVKETSDILDIPENTVKTYLRRAKQQLASLLKEWEWE